MKKIEVFDHERLKEAASAHVSFLLEDFIPKQSLGILVGEWGIGKSPFAIQLLMSLASHQPFLGRYNTAEGLVQTLYIDYENGPSKLNQTVETIASFLGLQEVPASWYVYSPNYTNTRPDSALQTSEEVYVREGLLEQGAYDFVVIDPLRMFNADAETKNKEAAGLISRMRKLVKETGKTIMFIHHPRKAPPDQQMQYSLENDPTRWMEQASGAASLVQNMDFRIGLQKTEDDNIICRHFTRGDGWSPVDYIERFLTEDNEPLGYVLAHGETKLEAFERVWLNDLPAHFSTSDFQRICGKGHSQVARFLSRLRGLSVIRREGKGLWMKQLL